VSLGLCRRPCRSAQSHPDTDGRVGHCPGWPHGCPGHVRQIAR
jgi:hypothetical protein